MFLSARAPDRRLRALLSAGTRTAILALLLLAAAGPYRPYRIAADRPNVLLADRSGSISPAGRREEEGILASLAADGEAREVPFGDERRSDPRREILRLAAADAARVILATDGLLEGEVAPLLAGLVRAGRAVGVIPLRAEAEEARPPEPSVPRIEVPRPLRHDLPVTVKVRAPGAARVVLLLDGKEIGRAPVEEGRGPAVFPDLVLPPGSHRLAAVAAAASAARASVERIRVEGPLPVLVVGASPGTPVPALLRARGLAVETAASWTLPREAWERARVIVSLPAAPLPPGGEALVPWVTGGGGLLVLSGRAPALSRYRGRAAADLLPGAPLEAEPEPARPPEKPPPPTPGKLPEGASPAKVEKEAATLTLLLVLDRSGSMHGSKIRMARAACLAAAETLAPSDRLGVLAFNEGFEWIQKPAPAGDLDRLARNLRRLEARGGTEIYPALKEAARAMDEEKTAVRHVILVSDGQDLIAGFHRLVTGMRDRKITVSTVGVGTDFDAEFLGSLAGWGAGRFWPALDPRELPRVVTLDTRRVIRTAKPPARPSPDVTAGREREKPRPPAPPPAPPAAVRLAAPLPFLGGLAFPPLPGVERTAPRFPARVALVTEEGTPVLLFWRYGSGRVALFAADPGDWAAWPDLGRFLVQVSRFLAGGTAGPGAAGPRLAIRGDRVEVTLEEGAREPLEARVEAGGARTPLPLARTGPRTFSGRLPPAPPGTLQVVTVRDGRGGESAAARIAPRPAEETARGLDGDRLRALARAAGVEPGRIPPPPPPERRPGRHPAHLPFLLAALVLIPVDTAIRRVRV